MSIKLTKADLERIALQNQQDAMTSDKDNTTKRGKQKYDKVIVTKIDSAVYRALREAYPDYIKFNAIVRMSLDMHLQILKEKKK